MKRVFEISMKNCGTLDELKNDVLKTAGRYEDKAKPIIERLVGATHSMMESIESNEWTNAYATVILDMVYQLERVLDIPSNETPENAKDGLF